MNKCNSVHICRSSDMCARKFRCTQYDIFLQAHGSEMKVDYFFFGCKVGMGPRHPLNAVLLSVIWLPKGITKGVIENVFGVYCHSGSPVSYQRALQCKVGNPIVILSVLCTPSKHQAKPPLTHYCRLLLVSQDVKSIQSARCICVTSLAAHMRNH